MEAECSTQSPQIPPDYPSRIKSIRTALGLTQTELAERIKVSFASINRWENKQTKPARLAWRQILDLEAGLRTGGSKPEAATRHTGPPLDFTARPAVVTAVAEATRLSYGHLCNPSFASEISMIDPLPHQRIAVYERMLALSPLRFLLADDAGAGKTIMTGLYLREILARRLMERVLIVPPAGLVGNWEREMKSLFSLPFRIITGDDARAGNPFTGPGSERVIVSIDTLVRERMFNRLRETDKPYDLVVFDEAHKLSARQQDNAVRKTDRYLLAEALAGVPAEEPRWELGWSAANLLLLTATPHMGKDFPYYCLWRLLEPDALGTFSAFKQLPDAERQRHFIRRTKEEMVDFEGRRLYPQRVCNTISYVLNPDEQALYDATTHYLSEIYNKAEVLNSSAARLVRGVFQRRQASSTYALKRSFERRAERLNEAIELVRAGRGDELDRRQPELGKTADLFETLTADEDTDEAGKQEKHEKFEEEALSAIITRSVMDLEQERAEVEALLEQARLLAATGEDTKFEKLREALGNPEVAGEKWIVFSEHRDTANFLVHRLEGLGFTGRVALVHGGLDYRERESQVELFKRPRSDGGASYLIATDAAGEGINLQFCWLMLNYDVPWNPARLEQRMGRIHRYGQKHDPVVITNLIAGETREGRVLKTLLDKLERMRGALRTDKVFDVIGRLFENVSLKQYLERATTDEGATTAIEGIEGALTEEQFKAIEQRDRTLSTGGDIKRRLPELQTARNLEQYRRLLPGHVRRFVTSAAPLIDLRIDGDPDGVFRLAQAAPHGLSPVLTAMDASPAGTQGRCTIYRPGDRSEAIWLHPGEAVFDRFCAALLSRHESEARHGAIFVDPNAAAPYLFHLARLSVVRRAPRGTHAEDTTVPDKAATQLVETRLIGLEQDGTGAITPCPIEHLLLLHAADDMAPGSVPLAHIAGRLTDKARTWITQDTLVRMAEEHRARLEKSLRDRLDWFRRGFDYRTAELIRTRQEITQKMRAGDAQASEQLTKVKDRQRRLEQDKERRLQQLQLEPALIVPGDYEIIAHALVVPTSDPEERERHDAAIEEIAMRVARAHEEASRARVQDVSRPDLARAAGLGDWPGFDLLSTRPPSDRRAIEVKGRARNGDIQLSDNEWANACNVRDGYWLYAVYDCATPHPRLNRVRDPFAKLLARSRDFSSVSISAAAVHSAAEQSG